MNPERAPRRVPPVVHQQWRDVSFVHWSFEPEQIQRLLPRRLTVETHDDAAWISAVCFSTTCAVAAVVPLPGPIRYPETNVRTYVTGPDGRSGLYFFSLDVTNRTNVVLGRATGLRYRHADMEIDVGERWTYRGVRRTPVPAAYDICIEGTDATAATRLDLFLTARWSAYPSICGRLLRYDLHHQPWPLRQARVSRCDQTLLEAEGIPRPAALPLAHVAAGVDANLAPSRVW